MLTDEEYDQATALGNVDRDQAAIATGVRYDLAARRLVVTFEPGFEVSFAPDLHQELAGLTDEQLSEPELWGGGVAILFAGSDAAVSVPLLRRGIMGDRRWMDERHASRQAA